MTEKLRFKLKNSKGSEEFCETITLENVFFSKLSIFLILISETNQICFLG